MIKAAKHNTITAPKMADSSWKQTAEECTADIEAHKAALTAVCTGVKEEVS